MTSPSYDDDTDLVVRFRTPLRTQLEPQAGGRGSVFYTDLNGLQTVRRETTRKLPLAANFFPMSSVAFIQEQQSDSCLRLSAHMRQAAGVASLKVRKPEGDVREGREGGMSTSR